MLTRKYVGKVARMMQQTTGHSGGAVLSDSETIADLRRKLRRAYRKISKLNDWIDKLDMSFDERGRFNEDVMLRLSEIRKS